jgi:hypothetical protein
MKLPSLFAILLVVLAGCSVRYSPPPRTYGDSLRAQQILEAASSLASGWTSPSSGGSGSSSGRSFENTETFSGEFSSSLEDLEALAEDLKVAFQDDIFGSGFQLGDGAEVQLGSKGSPKLATITVPFYDQGETGTIEISFRHAKASDRFEYEIVVREESR